MSVLHKLQSLRQRVEDKHSSAYGLVLCDMANTLRYSLSSWPFQLYFIPSILSTTLRFLTLFFRSYLRLIGPLNYNVSL